MHYLPSVFLLLFISVTLLDSRLRSGRGRKRENETDRIERSTWIDELTSTVYTLVPFLFTSMGRVEIVAGG